MSSMRTVVMMTKITAGDAELVEVGSKLKNRANDVRFWMEKICEMCPGVTFKAHYALLGQWDFMDIYEAPDEATIAQVSLYIKSQGAFQVESWLAIPYDQITGPAKSQP